MTQAIGPEFIKQKEQVLEDMVRMYARLISEYGVEVSNIHAKIMDYDKGVMGVRVNIGYKSSVTLGGHVVTQNNVIESCVRNTKHMGGDVYVDGNVAEYDEKDTNTIKCAASIRAFGRTMMAIGMNSAICYLYSAMFDIGEIIAVTTQG